MQKMIDRSEERNAKIGVISDSHDNMDAIKEAVSFFNEAEVDLVIHAGDIISPFTADEFEKLNCDMLLIYGNNDGDRLYLKDRFEGIGKFYRDPYIGELYGKKIAVTHIPAIVDALAEKNDIVIYGHTHYKDLRKEKGLILNPGESCGYLTGIKSVALLYPKQMDAKIFDIG